ncbi:MAG: DUF4080 domain-containing protein [Peptostreptococcaceae bacterium]|nr:DUF4080 domain-containing protein [Peptostreptococcaceae bacterium]
MNDSEPSDLKERETMKILLTTLNSKYVHMNLAIRYLYEAAGEYKEQIQIKEFTINNDDDYIFTELVSGGHELVCFSCYIWNIEKILYLAENLKKAKPLVKIVLGGPEVSFDREVLLAQYGFIDAVIIGEGELAFKKLCKNFLEGKKIETNKVESPIAPELIPFPYNTVELQKDKTLYYESSRGCPYRCSYCLSSIDNSIRVLPVGRVQRELDFFLSSNVKQVKFVDRTFNWNDDRCYDIINHLIENDNGVTNFHFEMCGELITRRLIDRLEDVRPGQMQFEIGIQSTNKRTLEAINRTEEFEKAKENIEKIISFSNIHVHLDLIAGLPFEDYESFKKSFNQVYAMKPDMLQLGFLKLLKGTGIREKAEIYGYVYRRKAPYEVISNKYISAEEIARIKQIEAVLDLYYNKGGFHRSLRELIKKNREGSFAFYEALADYFHHNGHQDRSHKKEDLYRILFSYAENENFRDGNKEFVMEEMKDLLLLDMKDTLNTEAVKKFERKGFYAL